MNTAAAASVRQALGGLQYFTIAVGCMIGIGWITVVGEWLSRAGPIGVVTGFGAGGIVMAGVAACYAELTGLMPSSGGDVVFADRVFGRDAAFFVGWFLVLMAVSVVAFEAISFIWVASTIAPWLGAHRLYDVLGQTITFQQVVLGIAVLGFMYFVNRLGVSASARVQDWLTLFKLVVMFAFIGVGITFGDPGRVFRAAPQIAGSSHEQGVLWIAATCAFWLGGFQVISQAAEERAVRTSLRTIGWITTGSVVVGVMFYVGVVITVSEAAPLEATIAAPLPAAAAAEAVFHSRWGSVVVLVAGMAGILATLNAMLLSGSRLSLALARFEILPAAFGRLDRRGAPVVALTTVTLFALGGVFAGRGLLVPVVDMASMSLILSYLLVCAEVLRLRRVAPTADRPFHVPGGVATVWLTALCVTAMAAFVMLEPAFEHDGFPVEWSLFLGWSALGGLLWFWRRAVNRRKGLAIPVTRPRESP